MTIEQIVKKNSLARLIILVRCDRYDAVARGQFDRFDKLTQILHRLENRARTESCV